MAVVLTINCGRVEGMMWVDGLPAAEKLRPVLYHYVHYTIICKQGTHEGEGVLEGLMVLGPGVRVNIFVQNDFNTY